MTDTTDRTEQLTETVLDAAFAWMQVGTAVLAGDLDGALDKAREALVVGGTAAGEIADLLDVSDTITDRIVGRC